MDAPSATFWTVAAAFLGGGGIGAVITGITNYMLAKAKQPVDQYDGLVRRLSEVIDHERKHFEELLDQERRHCDDRITKLEQQIQAGDEREKQFLERALENREKIGFLEGQLNEQRRLINTLTKNAEELTLATLSKDIGHKEK